MTPDADVPAWIARWHQRDARRGDRCRVCGHRRTVATEHGPFCRAHEQELPPPLPHHHDRDQDQPMTDDHPADQCDYAWCVAHQACSCPFANAQPHTAAGCKYNDDHEDTDG